MEPPSSQILRQASHSLWSDGDLATWVGWSVLQRDITGAGCRSCLQLGLPVLPPLILAAGLLVRPSPSGWWNRRCKAWRQWTSVKFN